MQQHQLIRYNTPMYLKQISSYITLVLPPPTTLEAPPPTTALSRASLRCARMRIFSSTVLSVMRRYTVTYIGGWTRKAVTQTMYIEIRSVFLQNIHNLNRARMCFVKTFTSFFCPILCARAIAWRSFWGFLRCNRYAHQICFLDILIRCSTRSFTL
jgi:hypothetical protein